MRRKTKATRVHLAVFGAAVAVFMGALLGLAEDLPSSIPGLITARSHSGQFVVYAGRPAPPPLPVANLATNQNFVRLEPTLAAVSCERIKQLLMRELSASAPWRGHIYMVLHPDRKS